MSGRYHFRITVLLASTAILYASSSLAEPSATGQTGLINMPSARIEEEGTLRLGISNHDPYSAFWSSVTLLPRLEISGRYTRIDGVEGSAIDPNFGDFRDKSFDAKLLLLRESRYLPALSIGRQDFTGTQLFSASYLALNKHFGEVDITLGYGKDRIDGVFGGFRYNPSWNKNLGFVAEYDAYDYRNDFQASLSGADKRQGGATYALEYKFGWVGTQLSYQRGEYGINVYVSIPLMKKEFIPKIDEPKPYTKITPQPSLAEWHTDPKHTVALVRELHRQGFKNVKLRIEDKSLEASLTHTRISLIGRAVGRAARTMLLLGPIETESIKITYSVNDLSLVTYKFSDAKLLKYYFSGETTWEEVKKTIEVEFSRPEYAKQFKDDTALILVPDKEESTPMQTFYGDEGYIVSFKKEDRFLSSLRLIPFNLRIFFNDPSGFIHYDAFALGTYSKHFGRGLFLNGAARVTLYEDVSDVTQPSNSLLPHVRSDIALYARERNDLSLDSLFVNKYYHTSERIYTRLSAGYYEEMFAGTGGQILYLPREGNWAVDFSMDWLKQREPGESFDFRDYSVITALAAFHYRFPKYGVTTTARIGRFLAKDEGVRFELKRRFRSGVELGLWYSYTNKDDITLPGTPDDPYRDKGLFVSIPLGSMLTKDTQQTSNLSINDATRDVGQMVRSPGDLYRLVERPLMLDSSEHDPLTDFTK